MRSLWRPGQIPRAVLLLGLVSLFTDLSSEMIYPLLPVFLAAELGAGAFALGLIEGVAESTASLLKIVSGIWTDKTRRRKAFLVSGYGLSGFARPLIGLAVAWPAVLVFRFLDRVGKGIRTSPRDALIADVTPPESRGTAYGIHRAMDHAGAVVGPLVAAVLMKLYGFPIWAVFVSAVVPSAIVLFILVFGIREHPPPAVSAPRQATDLPLSGPAPAEQGVAPCLPRHSGVLRATKAGAIRHALCSSPGFRVLVADRNFLRFLASLLVFTLGNSSDAFLLLRLKECALSTPLLPLLWSAHHVVKVAATYVGGRLADRVGRRTMIVGGWILYAAAYLGFALLESPAALVAVFLFYGIYFGFTEPAEKALVADLVPATSRGSAFGLYHGIVGIGSLPASLLLGTLWTWQGPALAFGVGAGLAAAAAGILLTVRTTPTAAPTTSASSLPRPAPRR